MKNKVEFLLYTICFCLGLIGTYFFLKNDNMEGVSYNIKELKNNDIVLTENGFSIGNDPYFVLETDGMQIDKVLLKGMDTIESLQIFYSIGEEFFTEENSYSVLPEKTENGILFSVDKKLTYLRIDFSGKEGTEYGISEIIINPVSIFEAYGLKSSIGGIVATTVAWIFVSLFCEHKKLKDYIFSLKKYRYLIEDMVLRDIKLKYRRSIVGMLWSILNPLLMMCVISAVFQNIFRVTVAHFPVYYLSAWIIYNFIVEATTGAMTSIINAGSLIKKVYIPKYIFPIQKCAFALINTVFSLIALLVVMVFQGVEWNTSILFIPIPLVLTFIFSIGLGMILATITVFFRDVIHLYGIFTMVWMYLTPIIYPIEILTDTMITIVKLNPLYYYTEYFRSLVLYGEIPGFDKLLIMCFWSFSFLILGMKVLDKKQNRFILFI